VRRALLALSLVLPVASAAEAVQVMVRPADAREVRGQITGIEAGILSIRTSTGQARDFRLADLMSVEMTGVKAPTAEGCSRVYTVSGDVIPAKISTSAGKLTGAGPWTERFDISTKDLSAILLPGGLKDKRALEAIGSGSRSKTDHIYLLGDDFGGSFEGLTQDGVKFKSFMGEEKYKLEALAAISFAELKPFKRPDTTFVTAELAGGGKVSGTPQKFEGGRLSWKTLGGMKLALKVSAISALRVVNGRVTFLADMKPEKVEQKPFIHGLPFVWTWRRNEDVFRKPLKLGGKEFSRGLGVAAYTRLTYRLDGKYKRFEAAAGVCDSVAPGGKTAFKVLVDGKTRFDNTKNPLSRGKNPRKVSVDVKGAKTLALIVDFGPDGSDLGDIGGWGEARVIK